MKKHFLTIIAAAALTAAALPASAAYWNISCQNASCQATSGGISISYASNDMSGNSINSVNGISGLPFNAEDFQAQEKSLQSSIDKTIGSDKKTHAGMDAGGSFGEGATGGAKIGTDSSKSIGITRKQSQGVSQSQGGRVTVNHTLGFFRWYAKTQGMCQFVADTSLQKYMCAAESIMDSYSADGGEAVKSAMYGYLFAQKAGDIMPGVDISAATNSNNNEMQTIKYAAFTAQPDAGVDRWAAGYNYINSISHSDTEVKKFNDKFIADKKLLAELLKPGQTAEKLEKAGKHELAVTKWLADCSMKWGEPGIDDIKSLPDRYLYALLVLRTVAPDTKTAVEKKFADAKTNKPAELQKITVERKLITPATVAGAAGAAAVMGGIYYMLRRRQKQQVADMPPAQAPEPAAAESD